MAYLFSSPANILSLCVFFLSFFRGVVDGTTFKFTNGCGDTVWPGVLANSGSSPLDTSGFALSAGESRSLVAPKGWSGRFWARTGCMFDDSGKGSCATGDCGSGEMECKGAGAAPPATLIEFTLDGSGGKDYYDVSLVDGYNLPVMVDATSASGCPSTGCVVDLNQRCPTELRVGDGDACRSACEAFGRPEYCCSGQYGNPNTCRPSVYSQMFKTACPRSYSYAYDDATSTFTCTDADYSITFCPQPTPRSQKATKNTSPRPTDAMLEDDAWLASLATGEASSAATWRSTSLALRASSAAIVIVYLLLS